MKAPPHDHHSMKEGARARTAIEILEELAERGMPADRLMSGYFRKRRFIGSKDRRAITGIVYGELRARAALDWRLGAAGLDPSPRTRVLAWLATEGAMTGAWDAAAITEAFDGGQYRPQPLAAPEAALIDAVAAKPLLSAEMPEAARVNCPDGLEPAFRAAFGEAFADEMAALNAPAPVDLRVNTLKASREEARSMLAADGIDAEPTPFSPWGLRIVGRVNLAGTRVWRDGVIDVQDEASQVAALLTRAAPGLSVLDACAGAGGKALAMAAMMANEGEIFACDTDLDRMRPIGARAARAGVQIIQLDPLWITEKIHGESKVNGKFFEIVLVDAPCSGTGTWRRNPDARWRLTAADVASYAEQQYGILLESAKFVQRGGHLVYATCSVLPEENEVHIERFTEQCSNFRVVPVDEVLRGRTGMEVPGEGPYMHLTPHRTGTDGFFAAVLERTA